jgi:hypothetical protein
MYDRTIPAYVLGLTALSAILAKAEAHCAANRIDPATLIHFRLFPDMLTFARQVQLASDHARRGPARLAGREPLSMADTEATFPELADRIARTIAHVQTFTEADFDGSAERTISFRAGGRDVTMSGADYATKYSLPNFYFHLTTAYNILRHNGVVLGKTDFLGA